MEYILVFSLSLSVSLNFLLVYLNKQAKKKPTPTYGAQELLASLTSGPAVLKIEVINVEDIILRSPRGAK